MGEIAAVQAHLAPFIGLGLAGAALCGLADKLLPLVPSYVLLIALGMLTVNDAGDVAPVIAAATSGSVLGSLVWYGLGRGLSERRIDALIDRTGRYLLLSRRRYDAIKGAYRANSFWVTLIAQIIPAVRVYIALPAGVLRLPAFTFAMATTLGAMAWNAPLIALGFLLRDTALDPIAAGIAAVVALLLIETAALLALRPRVVRRRDLDGEKTLPVHLRPTQALLR